MGDARWRVLRRGGLSAALVLVVLAGAGCGWGFDPYDDSIRGTDPSGNRRISFGQRIGPDGDGCWPDGGKVYCDLVSIGGLHWDAGEVRVADSSDIDIGSGFLCLRDTDGAPWCWEWSDEVPPRPARVPQGEVFSVVKEPIVYEETSSSAGFVCGQSPDFLRVVCWTVGVDQPEYRQSNHRFVDGGEWVMRWVGVDPPHFNASRRTGPGNGYFHAFTGKDRLDPSLRVLVTETLP